MAINRTRTRTNPDRTYSINQIIFFIKHLPSFILQERLREFLLDSNHFGFENYSVREMNAIRKFFTEFKHWTDTYVEPPSSSKKP